MSQSEHQIISTRRIVCWGPGALDFFLLQGNTHATETFQVNGAYSDCVCWVCSDCTTAYPMELRLAGAVDPSMEKRRFVFMGTVSGSKELTAPEFGPERVLGYYEPRGKNGFRGWIEPLTLGPIELAYKLLNINQAAIPDIETPDPSDDWIYYSFMDGVVDRVCQHRPAKMLLPNGRKLVGQACHISDAQINHIDCGPEKPTKKQILNHVARLLLTHPEPFTVTSNDRSVTWRALIS